MSKRLRCETAIVTGGSRGLGRAIAECFVAEGAQVMVGALDRQEGQDAAAEINKRGDGPGKAAFYQVDLGRTDGVQLLVEETLRRFGPPTVLVNNAATIIFKPTDEATCEDFEATMDVNVRGYWWLARLVYPYMKERGSDAIINVASTHPYQTKPGCFPYNMSKGAILAMNKAMAVDFGPSGIRVNALLPGIVDTKPTRDWLARFDDPEAKCEEVIAAHPLGRMPTVEEVAKAAVFLASREASGISGIELVVDCGRQAHRP